MQQQLCSRHQGCSWTLGPANMRLWPSQQPCIHRHNSKLSQGDPSSCRRNPSVRCQAKGAVAAAAAAASTGNAVLQGTLQVEARAAFLAELLAQGVMLPVLGGWVLVAALSAVASRARQVRAYGRHGKFRKATVKGCAVALQGDWGGWADGFVLQPCMLGQEGEGMRGWPPSTPCCAVP